MQLTGLIKLNGKENKMNIVVSKLLTSLLSEKILKAVLLKLGEYFIKKSENKLDDEIWAEVKKALK